MKRPTSLERYISANVFGRCGQAVTRLSAAGLVPRPQLPDSEREIREWWLVSPLLARHLQEAGQPIMEFCELRMWGRLQSGSLQDDPDLAAMSLRASP